MTHLKYVRWGRAVMFVLKNIVRDIIRRRYHEVRRHLERSKRLDTLSQDLPDNLQSRLASIAAREHAALLWNSKELIYSTKEFCCCLRWILSYAQSSDEPFTEKIAFIIPRVPHATFVGDAAKYGAGGYCHKLQFWFEVAWPARIVAGLNASPSATDYVTINTLEFLVWILELAAVITWFRSVDVSVQQSIFPDGLPQYPIFQGNSDNRATLGFTSKCSSPSVKAQSLIQVYAELLRQHNVGTVPGEYIPTELNNIADDISRPSDNFCGPFAIRAAQLFQRNPSLRNYAFFQPSPELLRLLYSRVFSKPSVDLPKITSELGHFVPIESII